MPHSTDVIYRVSTDLTAEQAAEARGELLALARILGRASASAAHRLGITFDMDDPQVARDVLVATFEALVLTKPPARRSAATGTRA